MKAITIQNGTLNWAEVEDIKPAANEVLVDVKATAVNRADLMQAAGHYPPPPGASNILGLEMAGIIVALGSEVTGWQVGDRVCALLAGGGYAQQVVISADLLIRLPDGWTFEMGAALPEVWLTAFVNLYLEADLQAGETVLLHAGASGVGTAGIQLAKASGAQVAITAGSAAKLAFCRALGADVVINRHEDDFVATLPEGVDVILDPVGASYLDKNLRVLRRFGRLVHIGLLGGAKAELNLLHVLGKRLKLIGSTLRSRPLAEKVAITQQFLEQFGEALWGGEIRPIIDCTFPIEQAQAAHGYIAANKNIGKVILVVSA
ncbi:MAG: NAD(P)H-quinone oxidoreductase [Candidatus Promineifilaceae bacterium]